MATLIEETGRMISNLVKVNANGLLEINMKVTLLMECYMEKGSSLGAMEILILVIL